LSTLTRKKMYDWFMSLKQPDGSFLVSHDAEVDVRGLYCLLVTATLLNILTPELLAGIPEFIVSCQSYEGGFSSTSHPYFSTGLLDYPRPSLGEAHGGYTFSALASWVLVQPYLETLRDFGHFSRSPEPNINIKSLLRWMTAMQGGGLDLGGFRGRTNKLVDGCYSWWVGDCFLLVEALGVSLTHERDTDNDKDESSDGDWDDVDGKYPDLQMVMFYILTYFLDALFDRKGLQEYILYAAQHPAGGLRDKPPK
jgi:protein farnesyltransferase subunit beta